AAWRVVQPPAPVPDAIWSAALAELADFDLSGCGHVGFATARDKAVNDFRRQNWQDFVDNGLAGKATNYNRPIPPRVQALFTTLLQHAQAEIVRILADQTQATYDLLERFQGELWVLKQATGQLRFNDVTWALVEALGRKAIRAD